MTTKHRIRRAHDVHTNGNWSIEEVRTMLIREAMTTPAVTVTTQTSTATALWLMHEEQIGSIPVVDDRGALIGVVNETDLIYDAVLVDARIPVTVGSISGTTPSRRIGDAMTHHVVTVGPEDEIDVALDLMRSTMLEHLPVVGKDRVVGTVGRRDLIRLLPQPRCHEVETSAGTACGADAVRLTRHR